MSFCQPCRDLLTDHRLAVRRVTILLGLAVFFTLLGLVTDPVVSPGLCKVYP